MTRCAVIVAVVLSLCGCGTVRNLSEQKEVYGGVKLDNEMGVRYRERRPKDDEYDIVNAACWAATVVDLPLSIVGDTLSLPFVLHYQAHHAKPATDQAAAVAP